MFRSSLFTTVIPIIFITLNIAVGYGVASTLFTVLPSSVAGDIMAVLLQNIAITNFILLVCLLFGTYWLTFKGKAISYGLVLLALSLQFMNATWISQLIIETKTQGIAWALGAKWSFAEIHGVSQFLFLIVLLIVMILALIQTIKTSKT